MQKQLQDFLSNKTVMMATNVLNLSLTISLCLIYTYRTYFMCQFDKKPIWVYIDGVSGNQDYLEKLEALECSTAGTSHTWYYYILLPIAHIYFFLEFILRASVQKYLSKYLL